MGTSPAPGDGIDDPLCGAGPARSYMRCKWWGLEVLVVAAALRTAAGGATDAPQTASGSPPGVENRAEDNVALAPAPGWSSPPEWGNDLDAVREPVLPEARYLVQWCDGSRTVGGKLGPWHDTKTVPKLQDRELFHPGNPVRWVMDMASTPVKPEHWVEFVGGDRLPGRVIAFGDGTQSPRRRLPPHLIVVPEQRVDPPDSPGRSEVRVTTAWLRRIVWRQVAQSFRPRTAFSSDGRQVEYRALRFGERSVFLLRDGGVVELPFADLDELHLALVDPWEAYFDQLTALAPAPEHRVVRYETAGGLRVTSTTERFQAMSYGAVENPASWYHLAQPAWSLEPLWLASDSIRLREYFWPHEVPLSRIEPVRTRYDGALGNFWPWQADRNVEGGWLESGGQMYAWGLGVHGSSELEFPLPEGVRSVRALLGLDHLAGRGGCARGYIRVETAREPLFVGKTLVGSGEVLDTKRLTLAPHRPARRLILQTEAAPPDAPDGADPFDIRDAIDWLEPMVELDPQRVAAELLLRGSRMIPCWQGWTVTTAETPQVRLVTQWDEYGGASRAYQRMVAAAPGPLRVSGRLTPRPYRDQLLVAVSRPPNVPPSRLEIRAEGRPVATFDIPVRHSPEAPPLAISLARYHGREIQIDLIQWPGDERSLVQWEALELVNRTEVP